MLQPPQFILIQGANVLNMSRLWCCYCQTERLFSRADSRIRHKTHSCQSRGCEKTRMDVSKIPLPTIKNANWAPDGTKFGEAFRFKKASSILWAPSVVVRPILPNHCSWITCKNCLWTLPPRFIIAMGRGKIDSETWMTLVYNFMKEFRNQTMSSLMSSRGFRKVDFWCWMIWWQREVKAKSCWIHSPNILIIKISPCCTCAKTCFHLWNIPRVFPGTPTTS